jgi:hypothetical protein
MPKPSSAPSPMRQASLELFRAAPKAPAHSPL